MIDLLRSRAPSGSGHPLVGDRAATPVRAQVAAARWAADGGREELPAEARAQLQDLLRRYESELARLERRASSSEGRRESGDA